MMTLAEKSCRPLPSGSLAMDIEEARILLQQLDNWVVNEADNSLAKTYQFRNFHETMAFVNALAWIAHQEDHHPDLSVSYKQCRVIYTTHSVNGLSENDFICAAKIDLLIA